LVGAVVDLSAVVGDHRPVALVEIGDALGQRGERKRVGAEIGLAVAIAERQRRAHAGADQQAGIVAEQDGDREGAVEQREDGGNGVFRLLALLQLAVDEVGDDFAVRLRQEDPALRLHLLA
jgi:hypothetical protein